MRNRERNMNEFAKAQRLVMQKLENSPETKDTLLHYMLVENIHPIWLDKSLKNLQEVGAIEYSEGKYKLSEVMLEPYNMREPRRQSEPISQREPFQTSEPV